LRLKLGLAIVVIAAIAFAVTLYRARIPAPTFSVSPIQETARSLTHSEVENLLGSQFVVVRRVRQVPSVLKQSFTNFTDLPFDMNDPGERIGTDFIVPGVPSRRLVFVGVGDNIALVVYDQGGYATTRNAVVFSYVNGGGAWGALLNDRSVDDVSALRMAIAHGRFHTWEKRK
jgi:hypothetical protein